MGQISAEEFYGQEAIDEELDEKMQGGARKYPLQGRGGKWDKQQHHDTNENFDDLFFNRTKELQDQMMKKIQQSEKQSQPNSANNQTLAYASGKDVLKIVSGS